MAVFGQPATVFRSFYKNRFEALCDQVSNSLMLALLSLAVLLIQANAQTCPTGQDAGPCLNQLCSPGYTCVVSADVCCLDSAIVFDSTTSATSSATTCVDKVNPSTGISDCAARASLCNDATYYDVMTVQCPKTCARCSGSSTNSTTCVDKINPSTGVSDCPALASLCSNSAYMTLMTAQCPKTCNRCSSTNSTSSTTNSTCVDKTNPRTGVSDCPARASLCTDSNYAALMAVQCPKTCNMCSSNSTSTTVSSTSCVDKTNPTTGVSDCSKRVAYCTDSNYIELMRVQCPMTCGFCSSTASTTISTTTV
ncbi:unnamed protein product [Nippostrongylus brasiliensis]|uniref:ShTK domain protein n=1 Tax=Nippostrongylus brasiliensis TaxID=27835 RepID=A0A0N4Y3E4_NIPBR|nr:unnamed protein product [Nippostrongylus brasiliensis]